MPNIVKQESAVVTYKGWLKKCQTPKLTRKTFKDVTTIEQSLQVKAPSLALIRKEEGEEFIDAYLKLWVIELQTLLNLKTKLNEVQIDYLAETILSTYWGITLSDLKIIFSGALNGVYGQFYESLSVEKVLKWFSDYFNERCNVAESQSHSDHSYAKSEGTGWKGERTRDVLTDLEKSMLKGK